MLMVEQALPGAPGEGDTVIPLETDRRTLAKRRWRGVAADGTEFGFDLHECIPAGSVIHRQANTCYIVTQAAEAVLEIPMPADARAATALAWQIGNLHFPLQVNGAAILTADDPAIRQMLERSGMDFRPVQAVFEPLAAVAGHGHHHHH